MMLDAVTFDLGCAGSPIFVSPDASGLAPLTLPDEFLRGQSNQPQPEFPSDTVRRFETAMSGERQIPPSVVGSLMAHMASESRNVESRAIAADTAVQVDPAVLPANGEPAAPSSVQPKIQAIAAPHDGPAIAIEKAPDKSTGLQTVSTAEKPVDASSDKPAVASIDKPAVETVDKPEVAFTGKPAVETADKPEVAFTGKPAVETIDKPEVAFTGKPVVETVDKPEVAFTETPKVVTAEKPVTIVRPIVSAIAPEASGNLDSRSGVEAPPVAADGFPAAPAAPSANVAIPESNAARPVEGNPVAASTGRPEMQAVAATLAEPSVVAGRTFVQSDGKKAPPAEERPAAAAAGIPAAATVDKPEEKAVAASAHVVVSPAAVEASVPQAMPAAPEAAAVSAASARTESIAETVGQIVEAVVGQIRVTPGIAHGECEIKIMLKPAVLDGSEVTMSAKDGTLAVSIAPATQEASAAAAAALPRLEIALAEHASVFHHVSVAIQSKKGNRNEAV